MNAFTINEEYWENIEKRRLQISDALKHIQVKTTKEQKLKQQINSSFVGKSSDTVVANEIKSLIKKRHQKKNNKTFED